MKAGRMGTGVGVEVGEGVDVAVGIGVAVGGTIICVT
jgi:hypothetical protein